MTRNEQPGFDPALYDADFYVWTQRQAAALRAMPHDPAVDMDHVAEEIEDLGKRDLREVGSSIRKLLITLLKVHTYPDDVRRHDWISEAGQAQWWAEASYTPSMRHLLDMDGIWRDFCRIVRPYVEERGYAWKGKNTSPFTLDELLSDDFDLKAVEMKLTGLLDPSAKRSSEP